MKIHRVILKRLRSKTPWNNTRAMKGDPIYSHHKANNSPWISQKANAGVYLPSVRCNLRQSKPLPILPILPMLVLRFFSRAYICWYLFLHCRHWKQTSSASKKKKKKITKKATLSYNLKHLHRIICKKSTPTILKSLKFPFCSNLISVHIPCQTHL